MDRSHRPDTTQVLSLEGTERIFPPEKTLHNIKDLIQEAGITRLACLTQLDVLNIPVYTTIRPRSKSLSSSQGKGMTDMLAICSAYMEALEYYFAERVPLSHSAPASILPPEKRCFEQLPRGLMQANFNHTIEWTTCTDYHSKGQIHVPRQFLSFDLTQAYLENAWFKKSTAGLASGNSKEEALVHSLYELVEHHAAKAFKERSFQEKKDCLLNLDDLPKKPRQLIQHFEKQDVECLVFQITSDLCIPTFYCIIVNIHPLRTLNQHEGYGCHLNAEIALLRAITEAAQSRLTYIAGSRDDLSPKRFHKKHKILPVSSFEKKQRFSEIPSQIGLSLEHQLQEIHRVLDANGFKTHLYQEYTPSHCPISVVHSIVPGLPI